eukprot:TRINITY_DN12069_c0_g2_i1.p1 TRINITY_DN12069_c0_g2~~TRINITY_DN12069_c0_g2_i1.p1  ORF type:complete len:200 (+),score=14.91 TRINITY_DN12069_c0_g2_i1:53-652(+)
MHRGILLAALAVTANAGPECRNCFGPIYYNQTFTVQPGMELVNITNSTGVMDCCASCNIDYYPVCNGWVYDGHTGCVLVKEKPNFINETGYTSGVPPGGAPKLQCRNCFGNVNYDSGYNLTAVASHDIISTWLNISSWVDCCATCEIDYRGLCNAWSFTPPPPSSSDPNGTCTFLVVPPVGPTALVNNTNSQSGTPTIP